MNHGDPLIYAHPKGDRPALYVAPYGLRHIIQAAYKGKPMLVYVPARAIRPATSATSEHP